MSALPPVVARQVAAAVIIGEAADPRRPFRDAGLARTERAETLEAALERADDAIRARAARRRPLGPEPPTVLMSPAAASFDMFGTTRARGRAFKAAVRALETAARVGGEEA